MHYVDEGAGDPVLLLHGEPTWAFLYRKMIPSSPASARCIAPDYFGFGRSDKPTDPGFYTLRPPRRVDRALRARARPARTSPLVVQDWGGPIGFRFAVENPERIARLVVLNTGIGARAPSEEWLRFQAFMRRVGTEIVAGQLVRLSLVQPVDRRGDRRLRRAVPGARVAGRDRRSSRSSCRPRRAPERGADARRCASELRSFDRPALVLFSDSDPIFSRRAAEVMADRAAERRARPAARRRGPLPPGGPGGSRSGAGSRRFCL